MQEYINSLQVLREVIKENRVYAEYIDKEIELLKNLNQTRTLESIKNKIQYKINL